MSRNLRIEWRRGSAWLGDIRVAETLGWGQPEGIRWRLSGGEWSEPIQEPKELQDACESGVWKALRAAGVVAS